MGVDIGVVTEDYLGNEDRRWLGTRLGTRDMRSITLDVSSFLAVHVTTGKGGIPSGTVLAKITATGLYGPYNPAGADGTEVASGFLWSTTKVGRNVDGTDLATAQDVGVALFWGPGIIKISKLPAFAGTVLGELDADAQTDLANFIRFEA